MCRQCFLGMKIGKSEGVGSRFHVLTRDLGGKQMEFDGTVTLNERPRAQTSVMIGRQFDIEASYTFEDLGGRTKVNLISVVTLKGFMMKLIFLVVGWLGETGRLQGAPKGTCELEREG